MHRRVTVIVAAVVPVVALAIAIAVSRSGSSSSPAKLPVAFANSGGAGTGAAAVDAASPAIYPFQPTHYVAANDLPDQGGSAHAYRVDGAVTDTAVESLAHALGVASSRLTVQRGSGQWSLAGVASDVAVASPCYAEPPNAGGTPATSSCPEPVTTTPPPPSLSESDARARAADVARASGVDVDSSAVAAQLQGNQWYVTIDPTVEGGPTSGFGTTVAFAADGTVAYASGFMAHAAAADTYPLVTTRQAVDQLNTNQVVPAIAVAPAPSPDGAPTTALPPRDVTITAVSPALLYQPTYDGQSGYLVPAYRFTADDGETLTAVAIDRSWFAPPPVEGGSASVGTGSAEPGSVGSAIAPAAPAEPPVTSEP